MSLECLRQEFEAAAHSIDPWLPCPSPECSYVPDCGDRYCDGCGTWLGVEGEQPPSSGPLKKILLNTGALRIVGLVERAEQSLNAWCQ
jgi:hypothetical protein